MSDEGHLLGLADSLLERAGPQEQVEVLVSRERETEISVRNSGVESLTVSDSAAVGVRVIAGGRQGIAWAGTLEPSAAVDALAQARDNARFSSEDPHAGLAAPDGVEPVHLRSHRAALAAVPVDDKVDMALDLERETATAHLDISGIEAAEYGDVESVGAVASTTGVRSVSSETACWLSVVALASQSGDTQTGFGFSLGREPGDLNPNSAAHDAARRATGMLGAAQPATEVTTVVLDPWVTAQLLEVMGSTLTADVVQRGRSIFAGRLGEAVAAPTVTLVDDPTNHEAFTAAAFDGEGLACRRNVLIEAGDLQQFLHNSYTARVGGTTSTGSAVRSEMRSSPTVGCQALRLLPGSRPPSEIIAGLAEGVLVRDVAGLHSGVNPVSGDFSVGAEGLRIREGELGEPLREFTIGSTLQRLLSSIVEVSDEQVLLPMAATGTSLVIDGVSVSGK